MNVVCSVSVTSIDSDRCGSLHIIQKSSSHYVVWIGFSDMENIYDLEDVAFCNGYVVINEKKCFVVNNKVDSEALIETRRECMALTEMSLRLQSVFRDIYYAGLYNNIDVNKTQKFFIGDEIQELDSDSLRLTYFTEYVPKSLDPGNLFDPSLLQCIYCKDSYQSDPTRDFLIHPYVGKNSDNKDVIMCYVCMMHWLEYREATIINDELIVSGERR